MKKRTIFLTVSIITLGLIVINSCSDTSDDNLSCSTSGSVIGEVTIKCACCPGWLVKTGNDTLKFLTVPENDLLRDYVNFYGFPVQIKFNYKNDNSVCSDNYKVMTCIDFDYACTKSGEIIGYDYRECLCCPGWIIKTGEDTIKVSLLPNESRVNDIVEASGFPIPVKLNYTNIDDTSYCKDFYKKITCLSLDD